MHNWSLYKKKTYTYINRKFKNHLISSLLVKLVSVGLFTTALEVPCQLANMTRDTLAELFHLGKGMTFARLVSLEIAKGGTVAISEWEQEQWIVYRNESVNYSCGFSKVVGFVPTEVHLCGVDKSASFLSLSAIFFATGFRLCRWRLRVLSIEALHLFIDWLQTKDLNQCSVPWSIMAVGSLFNRMLLFTDLIPVHLLYCGQTVIIGCNHTSFERTRAVRHIYGIIHHMQGLYIFCNYIAF